MSLGLDLGNSRFRSLRMDRQRVLARHAAASYCMVDDTEETQAQLERLGVTWATCGRELILMGDAAVKWSAGLGAAIQRVLPGGRIVAGDTITRQILQVILDMVIPPARRPGEYCCLTLPGPMCMTDGGEDGVETSYFAQMAQRKGYQPLIVSPSFAIVLSELGQQRFSGIGLTLGASCCDLSVVRAGKEILHTRVPSGTDWIDEEFARLTAMYVRDRDGQRRLDVASAAHLRMRAGSLVQPQSYQEELFARLSAEWLAGVLAQMGPRLQEVMSEAERGQRLPLTFGGGPSQSKGFSQLLENALSASQFPLRIAGLQQAEQPEFGVANGCLIHAELEAVVSRRVSAAA